MTVDANALLVEDHTVDEDVVTPIGDEIDAPREVWERIQARIEEHLHMAEMATTRLLEGPLDAETIGPTLESLDSLATWLGDLGMIPAARLTRQLRQTFESSSATIRADLDGAVRAAGLVEDLRSSVATTGVGTSLSGTIGDHLLVIGAPSQSVDGLIWFSVTLGFTVHHVHSFGGWPERTDAIVIASGPDRSLSETLLSSRSAAERYPGVPILVVSSDPSPSDRIELARHATSLMAGSCRPADIANELRRRIHIGRRMERIAVRGAGAGELAMTLTERGIVAWVADDDRDLLVGLETGRASAVALMPSNDNPSIIRLIRAQPTTRHSVVIEVHETKRGKSKTRLNDGSVRDAAGASAGFRADISFAGVTDVEERIGELVSLLRLRADADPDLVMSSRTGGVPWASAKFLAERLLLGIHRTNSVASLCVIRFDESDPTSEIDAVQEMMMREFRTDDLVTRSGDYEAIILLGGVDRKVAAARLERLTARFDSVAARVGVAEFPYDAQSVVDLVAQAQNIVDRSIADDGPRVATADWRPGGVVAHDVVLADSDPAVARVVGEALERCGLTVDYVNDGQNLLDRLRNPNIRLPRLLILEFDLNSVDGLTILRRLQPQAALRRFDVVMLSARSRESDLQQAFDLGVMEIIPKPFSPGILVRRILRLLEADR